MNMIEMHRLASDWVIAFILFIAIPILTVASLDAAGDFWAIVLLILLAASICTLWKFLRRRRNVEQTKKALDSFIRFWGIAAILMIAVYVLVSAFEAVSGFKIAETVNCGPDSYKECKPGESCLRYALCGFPISWAFFLGAFIMIILLHTTYLLLVRYLGQILN